MKLTYKDSKKRKGPGAVILALISLLFMLLGRIKLAFILLAFDFFVGSLMMGYFGIIKKDLDNKYVNFYGGVARLGGIPTTLRGMQISGYTHLIIGTTLGITFLILALII